MARRDGMGPMGMGPRTGRGLGNCLNSNRNNTPSNNNSSNNEKLLEEKRMLEEKIKSINEKLKNN